MLVSTLGDGALKKKVSHYPRGSKLAGPWKYDFKNNCVKCNRAYHLQKHHITYSPSLTVFLCEFCHSRITEINTVAAKVAKTSLYYKPTYTNQIRVILWRWFINNPYPTKNKNSVQNLSKSQIKRILLQHKLNLSRQNLGNAGEQPNRSQEKLCLDIGLTNSGVIGHKLSSRRDEIDVQNRH